MAKFKEFLGKAVSKLTSLVANNPKVTVFVIAGLVALIVLKC